jgi:hypothetical protein
MMVVVPSMDVEEKCLALLQGIHHCRIPEALH